MPVSIGPTLSRNNQQPPFLAQGNGVIYIKIARKDNQGNDNTLSLQELNNIRLKFSDAGIVDYPIANITEYPDYYLYQIFRTNITSSADDNIRNYRFSASIPSAFTKTVTPSEIANLDAHYTVNTDVLNYFNGPPYAYTFGDTPNIKIIVTASAEISNTSGTQAVAFYLAPVSGSSIILGTTVNVSASNQIVSFYGTASSFIENESYVLKVNNDSPNNIQVTSVNWIFTQSIAPNSSSNLTILEPYLESEFEYSDCNVLLNNADQNQIGSFFRRVLYDNGSIIPSNFQEILSQSAEYAQVKDYNYTARAQIYPRYDGVRTTSPDFNLNTITVEEYEGTRLNSLRTGNPNVQSLGTYFAYFDWLGGTTPELIGKAVAHILYLIDENGTVLNPNLSGSYYYDLIDSFESGKNANIVLNAITGNPQSVGIIPIIRPGTIPMGIIASQTGSGYNVQPTMSFGTSTTIISQFASSYALPAYQTFPVISGGSNTTLDLVSTINSSPNVTLDAGNNTLELTNSANNTQIALNFQCSMEPLIVTSGAPYTTFNVVIYFQESPDGISWSTMYQESIPLILYNYTNVNITTQYFTPINGKYYRAYIYNGSGYYSARAANGKFVMYQNPPATSQQYITSSYWVTGSSSKNILTGSQFSALYGTPNLHQQNYSSSGYFDFLTFQINPSDQIRFEGSELQVYIIMEVLDSGSLYLTLDRDITDGTDLDSFLIRRFDPNPNYITLDTDLTTYQGGSGFVFPQYTTNTLQANFDRITKDLKEKGLIS